MPTKELTEPLSVVGFPYMNPASAATSLNQVSRLHKHLLGQEFQLSCFDFGAGKKGKIDIAHADKKCPYFPYDPFCRSLTSNADSLHALNSNKVSRITCANVLNVIEDEFLDAIIKDLSAKTLKTECKSCWISVYHKSSLPVDRKVGKHFQRNRPIAWYIPHLEKHFKRVRLFKGFIVCRHDNLDWT